MNDIDVLIIGGGIHGAGVAQAAAARGYSVRLLEKSAIASGTSSRSSKLIHGGLRYLESAQFALVRECLHERSVLLKIAPHLVKLRPFYIPVYKETGRRPWQIRSGLTLYALLAGLDRHARYQKLSSDKWSGLDGLKTAGLQAVYRYYDAQTDDAALTRAVMQSARNLGAELCMPAELIGAKLENNGSIVAYRYQQQEYECRAGVIVNAAGPWVNSVLEKITPPVTAIAIDLVQGTHILVDGVVEQGLYYLEAPQDKRAVFVMPWKNRVLVGTTETVFRDNPDRVEPLPAEIHYLVETLAYYFPGYQGLAPSEIRTAFAGLRVLPRSGSSAFFRSRETILQTDRPDKPRLVNIYGGKLTAYRITAEKVLNRLADILPQARVTGDTSTITLP